jgi:hypothetical protein
MMMNLEYEVDVNAETLDGGILVQNDVNVKAAECEEIRKILTWRKRYHFAAWQASVVM